MSELLIIHRQNKNSSSEAIPPTFLMWETCRRQIFFSEEMELPFFPLDPQDEVYHGIEAEGFLIEVLCGLKSPLVGETEVFGQFKNWWNTEKHSDFKRKYSSRIQQIYSVVKKIREENLCGMGSQSYGSLLRKKIHNEAVIDFIGAGQLVEEIIPWISKRCAYRIWCRDVEKVLSTEIGKNAQSVHSMNDVVELSKIVVVAAPMGHGPLTAWLSERGLDLTSQVYDFRSDSISYALPVPIKEFAHLDHFVTEVSEHRGEIEEQVRQAREKISMWQQEVLSRAQVRPFGWDDL